MAQSSASSLYFRASGPQDAPSIVFLHGGGGGGWMWEPVTALLPDYHCIVPDLPEHGHSRNMQPFSMQNAAHHVAQIIQQQAHGGKAAVVGLSEGAQVTVALLSRHPQLIEKAFVSSALLKPIIGGRWLTPAVLGFTYRTMMAPLRNWDYWIRLNMKYATGIPERYYPQFKKDFQETTQSNFVNLMHANQAFRLPSGLEKVQAATLVVVGKKELAPMIASARQLAATLPHAQAYLLDLGSKASMAQEHNWALTTPQAFAATVRAWLEDAPLPDVLHRL